MIVLPILCPAGFVRRRALGAACLEFSERLGPTCNLDMSRPGPSHAIFFVASRAYWRSRASLGNATDTGQQWQRHDNRCQWL
jgi:hypothetical protein